MEKKQKGGASENGSLVLYSRDGKPIEIFYDKGEDGPEYYRDFSGRGRGTINSRNEQLINELHSLLRPLNHLALTFEDAAKLSESDETPAICDLLKSIEDEISNRMEEICDALEKKVGEITLHISDEGCFGLKRNEILDVTISPESP